MAVQHSRGVARGLKRLSAVMGDSCKRILDEAAGVEQGLEAMGAAVCGRDLFLRDIHALEDIMDRVVSLEQAVDRMRRNFFLCNRAMPLTHAGDVIVNADALLEDQLAAVYRGARHKAAARAPLTFRELYHAPGDTPVSPGVLSIEDIQHLDPGCLRLLQTTDRFTGQLKFLRALARNLRTAEVVFHEEAGYYLAPMSLLTHPVLLFLAGPLLDCYNVLTLAPDLADVFEALGFEHPFLGDGREKLQVHLNAWNVTLNGISMWKELYCVPDAREGLRDESGVALTSCLHVHWLGCGIRDEAQEYALAQIAVPEPVPDVRYKTAVDPLDTLVLTSGRDFLSERDVHIADEDMPAPQAQLRMLRAMLEELWRGPVLPVCDVLPIEMMAALLGPDRAQGLTVEAAEVLEHLYGIPNPYRGGLITSELANLFVAGRVNLHYHYPLEYYTAEGLVNAPLSAYPRGRPRVLLALAITA